MNFTDNEKRWVVTGVAMIKVLLPDLRSFVEQQVHNEYTKLVTSDSIHSQTAAGYLKKWKKPLKYENINGNEKHKLSGKFDHSKFDFKVSNHVDFAKLYLLPFMVKFNAFDEHCDASAVLLLLGGVPVFSPAIQTAANDLRDQVRNSWAHANFTMWDEAKFQSSFRKMEALVKTLCLPGCDETELLNKLHDWETKGTILCTNSPLDPQLLKLVQHEIAALRADVVNYSSEGEDERNQLQQRLNELDKHFQNQLEEVNAKLDRAVKDAQQVVHPDPPAVPPRRLKEINNIGRKLTTTNGIDIGNQCDSADPQYENLKKSEDFSQPRCKRVDFSDEKYVDVTNGKFLWEPQSLSGVLEDDFAGCQEMELDSFQHNVDGYLERFACMTGSERETTEQFILQIVLPGLEKSNQRRGFKDLESSCVLAKFSCCKNSPAIVNYSLSQLLTSLSRYKESDYSYHCNTRITQVEKILRSSLISDDAIYKDETPKQHSQRLTVYSRLISLFNIFFVQEKLPLFTDKDTNELQSFIKLLKDKLANHRSYKKKDQLRYSVEFIIEGIKRLLDLKKGSKELDANLKTCQTVLNDKDGIKDVTFQQMFGGGRTDWFTPHVILMYLHTQTYDNDKAIRLIWKVVKAKQSSIMASWRTDWRFALIAATLLTDICMSHKIKDTRVMAGSYMALYLKSKEMKKSSEARAVIERHAKELLFCPDEETIKTLAYQLFSNKDAQNAEVSCEALLKTLCWSYRHQSLELTGEDLSNGTWNLLKRGYFRGKEVVVKVLKVRAKDLTSQENEDFKDVRSRLLTEVYAIKKLNENPHPNIVRVFGYNTNSRPYHLITEYMRFYISVCTRILKAIGRETFIVHPRHHELHYTYP